MATNTKKLSLGERLGRVEEFANRPPPTLEEKIARQEVRLQAAMIEFRRGQRERGLDDLIKIGATPRELALTKAALESQARYDAEEEAADAAAKAARQKATNKR